MSDLHKFTKDDGVKGREMQKSKRKRADDVRKLRISNLQSASNSKGLFQRNFSEKHMF